MASLLNTANGLSVLTQALNVTENNVMNANTPGYVKQTQEFEPLPFDPSVGLPGGVSAGPMLSSRDAFAEQTVREQQSAVNYYTPQVSALTALESSFDLSSSTSISSSLSSFFQSVSQLSVNPNDAVSRQAVLDQAGQLARSFQQTASGLAQQSADVGTQVTSTVADINSLASTIAKINADGRVDPNGGVDAGVDANLYSSLESLSQLAGITVLQQTNGQVNVYLGGQTPLVIGNQTYAIQSDISHPQTAVLDANGKDVTSQVTTGQLGGLLNVHNNSIPSYLADLNTLAQNVSDQVDAALDAGIDANGSAPVTDLFAYDAA
jgi:flagellar hook-associated protein 1 FlgK